MGGVHYRAVHFKYPPPWASWPQSSLRHEEALCIGKDKDKCWVLKGNQSVVLYVPFNSSQMAL
jgi:hypothetical protein